MPTPIGRLFAWLALLLVCPVVYAQPQPYNHNRFGTMPIDIERDFIAFTVSFDGDDDGETLGVPEWVAYEMRATPDDLGPAPARLRRWFTDDALHTAGIAPDDDSYENSGYSRGYMCRNSHAHRISDAAARETHTVLNACPQMQSIYLGAWLSLEDLTADWADKFGRVWIVTGPVFFSNKERHWIGDPGEVPVAIPDAFFKIVVRTDNLREQVLAFLIPMEGDESHSKRTVDVHPYLTSVDIIEALTGLDLLTSLPDSLEDSIERRVFTELWSTESPIVQKPKTDNTAAKERQRRAAETLRLQEDRERRATPLLVESWSWHIESGYAMAEGEVTNRSDQSLENVMAVVSFYTEDGQFIKSATALVEFNPILSGQTTSFTVMATSNPRIKSARLAFKSLLGGSIQHKKSK